MSNFIDKLIDNKPWDWTFWDPIIHEIVVVQMVIILDSQIPYFAPLWDAYWLYDYSFGSNLDTMVDWMSWACGTVVFWLLQVDTLLSLLADDTSSDGTLPADDD